MTRDFNTVTSAEGGATLGTTLAVVVERIMRLTLNSLMIGLDRKFADTEQVEEGGYDLDDHGMNSWNFIYASEHQNSVMTDHERETRHRARAGGW